MKKKLSLLTISVFTSLSAFGAAYYLSNGNIISSLAVTSRNVNNNRELTINFCDQEIIEEYECINPFVPPEYRYYEYKYYLMPRTSNGNAIKIQLASGMEKQDLTRTPENGFSIYHYQSINNPVNNEDSEVLNAINNMTSFTVTFSGETLFFSSWIYSPYGGWNNYQINGNYTIDLEGSPSADQFVTRTISFNPQEDGDNETYPNMFSINPTSDGTGMVTIKSIVIHYTCVD